MYQIGDGDMLYKYLYSNSNIFTVIVICGWTDLLKRYYCLSFNTFSYQNKKSAKKCGVL